MQSPRQRLRHDHGELPIVARPGPRESRPNHRERFPTLPPSPPIHARSCFTKASTSPLSRQESPDNRQRAPSKRCDRGSRGLKFQVLFARVVLQVSTSVDFNLPERPDNLQTSADGIHPARGARYVKKPDLYPHRPTVRHACAGGRHRARPVHQVLSGPATSAS